MLIKQKAQRVVVLMDVQNMYHSAKNLHKKKVDFKEILKTAVSGRQLIRAIGYVIRTETGEEKSFFDALSKIGIELKAGSVRVEPESVSAELTAVIDLFQYICGIRSWRHHIRMYEVQYISNGNGCSCVQLLCPPTS